MSGRGERAGDHLLPGREQMIPALLKERENYVRYGRTERVRLVDEQLAAYGYDPEVGFVPTPQPTAAEKQRARLEQAAERERKNRVRALREERALLVDRQERATRQPRDRVELVDEQLEHYEQSEGAGA